MISRRAFLAGTTALCFAAPLRAAPAAFDPGDVIARARALASADYVPQPSVPQDWQDISYDQYRKFWFRTADALWAGTGRSYEVDFFLPGLYFPRPVRMNTVTEGEVRPFHFDLSLFDSTDKAPALSTDVPLGFSGLRLRTELAQPGIKEEFCVFQGASYFRAIGAGQIYGLSARGLAIDTAEPHGEEFPDFIEFWLEAPGPDQRSFTLHALLDSPSVAGAYRFDITPGAACVMEVTATLFPRRDLVHAGIAPLTSMFQFDETNRSRFDDFRSAVHDSDGLLMRNGAGETLWRPLANPRKLQVSGFQDTGPRGFGLMQRARRQAEFGDLEAFYHRRPGLWVEPREDWGPGSVTLVEIPTDKEIYDNIVAYWRPANPYPAGGEVRLSYRLTWGARAPIDGDLPRAMNTRLGRAEQGGYIVTVDFEAHPALAGDLSELELHLQTLNGEITPGILQRNPETGGARLAFRFDPGAAELTELRAQLRRDGRMASEVWLYRWTA